MGRLRDAGPAGQRPDHDPAQLHARRDRLSARPGRRPGVAHPVGQHDPGARGGRRRRATGGVGGLVPRRRRSPASSSRRSSGTITRCCCSCRSRICWPPAAGGRWSSRWPRPSRWSGSRRPIVYPIAFWVTPARRARSSGSRARTTRARRVTRRLDRDALAGLRPRGRLGAHLLAGEPRVRRRSWRLLLPRRRVPPRSDVARHPASARTTSSSIGRPLLRAVRPVPGRRADAARRARRAGRPPTSGSPASTRCSRPPASGMCWWLLGRIGVGPPERPALADGPVRVLDPDPVGDDPRRRLAHRAPHRDDPDVRLPHRAVGPPARLADRAAGRRRVPDTGAARVRDPVLRAHARPPAVAAATRPGEYLARRGPSRGARGSGSASASLPAIVALLRLQPGPLRDAARVRATRSRRCRRSSRRYATRGSSRSPTSR